MTSEPLLTVYSTRWCPHCIRLRHALRRDGIAFHEIDVEKDATAARFVLEVNNGVRAVPTVVCPDGTALTNPTVDAIRAQLG